MILGGVSSSLLPSLSPPWPSRRDVPGRRTCSFFFFFHSSARPSLPFFPFPPAENALFFLPCRQRFPPSVVRPSSFSFPRFFGTNDVFPASPRSPFFLFSFRYPGGVLLIFFFSSFRGRTPGGVTFPGRVFFFFFFFFLVFFRGI